MTTEARLGWGGELQISTDETYAACVEIVEVRSFSVPTDEADEHEVTHLKSPNKRKEFIAGMIDAGEVTATLNYVPGGASDLLLAAALTAGDTRAVRFLIPDNDGSGTAAWSIATYAFVKRYSPDEVSPNAPITATLVLRITGARTEQAATTEGAS